MNAPVRDVSEGADQQDTTRLKPGRWSEIAQRDCGWLPPLPIRSPRDYQGPPTNMNVAEFVREVDAGENIALPLEYQLQQVLAGRSPSLTCVLGPAWKFDAIERDAWLRRGHQFEGRRAAGRVQELIRAVHDIEPALLSQHPVLPAEAVADFWTSWNISRHLADFCRQISEASGPQHIHETDLMEAIQFVERQLAAFAHEIRVGSRRTNTLTATVVTDTPRTCLGRNVKRFRLKKGWSQRELAVKFGADRKQIQRWENGSGIIPRNKKMLAQALEVSVDDLDK
jgi:ribosome-binding protein aMBF1 (putative translation factor)